MRHFKHFTFTDRLRLEQMLKDNVDKTEIAKRLNFHISAIYREIERGTYEHKNYDWTYETRYAAEIAENRYRANLAAKGAQLKIGKDRKLADFIEHKIIKEKFSPAAVLMYIKSKNLEFSTSFCTTTLYTYIDKRVFLELTNKHLPVKSRRKRKYNRVRAARPPAGESIEQRPSSASARDTFGHWEMDTVKGMRNKGETLLVLTERQTRHEIKVRMADNTTESVIKALHALKRRYGEMFSRVFQTITVDNGSEFANAREMENFAEIYYCHPYSSWERGSNENQNKLIRRWIPKGTPIEHYTDEELDNMENWINNYPRAIFAGKSSQELFDEQMAKLIN